MSVLMIAEKPSLAQSLAHILSNGNMNSRKSGSCPVHEYYGSFFNNHNTLFKFTSVCGHLFSADFEVRFRNWDKSDPIELYSAKIVRSEANPKMNLVSFLKREARNCKYLVLWLDCDREGENICFEIIDVLNDVMQISFRNPQTVFRAHFSAITPKDIKDAFRNLRLPNQLEALSVTARQELDLIIGCSFTRYQTRYFHGKYGDLDSSLISYGPCQVPTLAFCVNRHDEIQNFKPTPYWTLAATVAPVNFTRQLVKLDWTGENEFNYGTIRQLYNSLKDVPRGKVVSLKKSTRTTGKPKALNTVEMLRVASAKLGIGPHQAMQIAEKLYTQGYISYPRTETSQYPKNFNFHEILEMQRHSEYWGSDVGQLLQAGIAAPKSGHDAGDHPPITPMRAASHGELPGDMWRLYEFIARNFIASLAPDMLHEVTTLKVEIKTEIFTATCSTLLDPGFTKFLPRGSSMNEQSIPSSLKENDEVLISEIKIVDHVTHAPSYLTESELISLMEKHGIGTDASIPTHINNICQRNYVTIGNGRMLIPTKLGILLIHGYQRIDNDLVSSSIRSDMEKELDQIAKGTADFQTILKKNIGYYKAKFTFFMENIQHMDELFNTSFTSLVETGKPFSKCGKCKRYLRLITAKPERLVCPICEDTYNIPSGGTVKKFKEVQCPLDDFDLLYFNGQKSFVFCPNCYNNPPFEDMTMGSACSSCPNSSCAYSVFKNSIGPCLACDYSGLLVLDLGSGPSTWKFNCNKCSFSMSLFKGASKVSVESDKCTRCQWPQIKVKYNENKTSTGPNLVKGCMWCSPELAQSAEALRTFSNTFVQQQRNPHSGRPQLVRGGGGGYGRGGHRAGRGGHRGGHRGGRGRARGGHRGRGFPRPF